MGESYSTRQPLIDLLGNAAPSVASNDNQSILQTPPRQDRKEGIKREVLLK